MSATLAQSSAVFIKPDQWNKQHIGHQFASIDPLNQPKNHFVGSIDPKEISMESFEFTQSELDLKYDLKSSRKADA